ncbi:MAG: 23S rRNA (guanosine(2251)-2'-O)-methyltransferase RlmB [Candidatus Porifericomitaceae bacterium WSBS_2022_MAG_OTU9]
MQRTGSKQKLIFGIHGVEHALRQCPGDGRGSLYLRLGKSGKKIEQLRQLSALAVIAVQEVDKPELDKLCAGGVHQGVALLLPQADGDDQAPSLSSLLDSCAATAPPLLLLLDQVQDPHNFGACLRTAEAAGATGVIMPKRNSAPLSPVARKVASGAAEHLPVVRVANLRQAMDSMRQAGVWMLGLDGGAEQSLYEIDLTVPLALVVGAEGQGLRRLTRECCDYLAKIPMHGNVSSLNLAAAAAVALFEVVRQRGLVAKG